MFRWGGVACVSSLTGWKPIPRAVANRETGRVVTRKPPSHLRLHVEDGLPAACPRLEKVPSLRGVVDAFRRVTGWGVRCSSAKEDRSRYVWSRRVEAGNGGAALLVWKRQRIGGPRMVRGCATSSRPVTWPLRWATCCRTCIGTRTRFGSGKPNWLPEYPCWCGQRGGALGRPLGGGAQGGCAGGWLPGRCRVSAGRRHSAAETAFVLGPAAKPFPGGPAAPGGAAADLEALVGHAVALEDTSRLSHWRVPEEFRSAVCVPISSPTVPFGTLWAFCDRPRKFSDEDSNLIEIVAGRVAADLERSMLLHEKLAARRFRRQLEQASRWQQNRLPQIKPLLDGWQIAGWTTHGDSLGGNFHDWCVLPDGNLAWR